MPTALDRRLELENKDALSPAEHQEYTFGSPEALRRATLRSFIKRADRDLKQGGLSMADRERLTRKRAAWNAELIALQPKPADVLPPIPVYDTKPMAAE